MEKIAVMVNGQPGQMATNAAWHVDKSPDFKLIPVALTGPEISERFHRVGNLDVELITPDKREDVIKEIIKKYKYFLSADYTTPSAVNDMVDFYCRHELPHVVGTTGGDRDALEQRVRDSNTIAVIAPNMSMQIVAFMALIEDFSKNHKGAWVKDKKSGLYIRESHQGVDIPNEFYGKKDTSGTAKAMVQYFNKIGVDFDEKDIAKIRDIEDQKLLGIPEWALQGHGWHRYKLYSAEKNKKIVIDLFGAVFSFLQNNPVFEGYKPISSKLSGEQEGGIAMLSPDETVLFRTEYRKGEVKNDHNVNGRDTYGLGNLEALRFEQKKTIAGEKGKVYSMIDVLKG